MLTLPLMNTVYFLSFLVSFLHGLTIQGLFYFSTRNVSYSPGNEMDDFALDDGKTRTWCAYRCLEASCLVMDVCYLTKSARCRLWQAMPAQVFTGNTICRRFRVMNLTIFEHPDSTGQATVNPESATTSTTTTTSSSSSSTTTTPTTDQLDANSASTECTEGCNCPEITSQIFSDKELYSVTLNGTATSYICKVSRGAVWTVIQRRLDGSVTFHDKLWDEYENGFGSLSNEFWIGLKEIHRLTSKGLTVLDIQLGFSGNTVSGAQYTNFFVDGAETNYQLSIGGYIGTAGDKMLTTDSDVNLNGMMFTTIDKDNDLYSGGNCAAYFHGAWWYNNCAWSNLNGMYGDTDFAWGNHAATLIKTTIMIKKP